jgi:hypothetical protein
MKHESKWNVADLKTMISYTTRHLKTRLNRIKSGTFRRGGDVESTGRHRKLVCWKKLESKWTVADLKTMISYTTRP